MGNQETKGHKNNYKIDETYYNNSNLTRNNVNSSDPQTNPNLMSNSNVNNNLNSRYEQPSGVNYENKPEQNREISDNQNVNSNVENINSYPQNNENSEVKENPIMTYLNKAYQMFIEAGVLCKQFSFYEALFKYEEAQKITTTVYYKITDDEQLKIKVDHFLKNINAQIDFVNFQIKNQFAYKEKAGFASRGAEKIKVDYLEKIRKGNNDLTDSSKSTVVEKEKPVNKENSSEVNKKNEKDKDNQIVSNDLKSKILAEIVDNKPGVKFVDVIGLEQAKQILKEIIVLPNLRPDLFTGLRSPPRGLLLFGPPGVGKTMIAKAVATECECTFFSISASSLTSKYLGESEKLVRALFDLAFEKQPSVVFIDEIESILSKRSDGENDATKRLKTEFLVQFDGVGSDQSAKVLIIGATNRPQELDTAVLRRLPKRIYINPFNKDERTVFIKSIMKNNENELTDEEFAYVAEMTENYSNSDLKELCREAAYEPIRELTDLANITKLRPTVYGDFIKATKKVRGTLNESMLSELLQWNQLYGAIS